MGEGELNEEKMEQQANKKTVHNQNAETPDDLNASTVSSNLWTEIENVTLAQLCYARKQPHIEQDNWDLFYTKKDMKIYRRKEEHEGRKTDPIRASC